MDISEHVYNPLYQRLRRTKGKVSVFDARLAFERIGRGLPVVFVPPIISDRRVWSQQVRPFARQYQVVRYDLRGYGHSSAGLPTLSHAQDLFGLIEALDLKRAALVGLDGGAEIVLKLAVEHPERVGALVLVNPSIRYVTGRLIQAGRLLTVEDPPPLRSGVDQRAQFAALWQLLLIRYQNVLRLLMRRWPRRRHAHYPLELRAEALELEELSAVVAPTLLVRGEWTGALWREGAELLQATLPHATAVVVPRVSFTLPLQAATAFNQIVLDFLATRYSQERADRTSIDSPS